MSELLIVLMLVAGAPVASSAAADARQIVQTAQDRTEAASQHYEGTLKVVDARGRVSDKRWIYDRIGSHGRSKAVLRFTEPAEVKGVALLIVNHPDRSSDQWMWTPAIHRDRRIALQDRSTRFFGTDFSFEDLEERDIGQYRLPTARRGARGRRGVLEDRGDADGKEGLAVPRGRCCGSARTTTPTRARRTTTATGSCGG